MGNERIAAIAAHGEQYKQCRVLWFAARASLSPKDSLTGDAPVPTTQRKIDQWEWMYLVLSQPTQRVRTSAIAYGGDTRSPTTAPR
jgi:hypothetical protein